MNNAMKKYALVTGATGGIGSGFVRELLRRGYAVYLQYRDTEKLEGLRTTYANSNVFFLYSPLNQEQQIKTVLSEIKQNNIMFDVIVLAAGGGKMDAEFSNTEEAAKKLTEANMYSKKVFIDAFTKVFSGQSFQTNLFLVSSHISDISLEEARNLGEFGYVVSTKGVNELAETTQAEHSDLYNVHLLKTLHVETNLLKEFRAKFPDIQQGMTADAYAEQELTKAGL